MKGSVTEANVTQLDIRVLALLTVQEDVSEDSYSLFRAQCGILIKAWMAGKKHYKYS